MYVAPRPKYEDDPLFAVRLSLVPVLGFLIGMALSSPLAMLFPTLALSLFAGNRKALDFKRVIGAPIALSGMIWMMSFVVQATQGIPMLLVLILGIVLFLSFFMVQMRGDSVGMLLAVAIIMMATMGVGSYQSMVYLRSEMTKAALAYAVMAPLLYALLPPRSKELEVEIHVPANDDQRALRALIRAVVMLGVVVFIVGFLGPSEMMLAIGALFVLIFPTQKTGWSEAIERSASTVMGGLLGLAILGLLMISGHLIVLLAAVALVTLYLGQKMMDGPLPPMVYQYSASVMVSLIGSALMTSEPSFAYVQRVVLTVVGGVGSAFLVSVIEGLVIKPSLRRPAAA